MYVRLDNIDFRVTKVSVANILNRQLDILSDLYFVDTCIRNNINRNGELEGCPKWKVEASTKLG